MTILFSFSQVVTQEPSVYSCTSLPQVLWDWNLKSHFNSQIIIKHTEVWSSWGGGLVTQPCSTLCDPMDCSLPGSSVHGILQARILEWVALPFPRGSSQPRDRIQVSLIEGRFFTIWAIREGQIFPYQMGLINCQLIIWEGKYGSISKIKIKLLGWFCD